ncbi:MAG TPA: ribose-phosphate diphosphokinase [Gammaproteobacteria bacterium]|nr:ribose-phosphate diphosphokinase [Gammaproteobacteria bacterium]
MRVLGFVDYEAQGRGLARALDCDYAPVDVHRFPDGESKLTLPAELPEQVVVCRSLDRPNDKLIELLLTATTARRLGAQRLTLVAPYLCYMRQDKAFHPGEAVSQPIIGGFLAGLFDAVITVDPHLHRVHQLADAVPAQQAVALSATAPMGDFLHERLHKQLYKQLHERQHERPAVLLLGPDSESRQWVSRIAERDGLDYDVASKTRLGDRQIEIALPERDWSGKHVIIVDDVISSGETIAIAAQQCIARGAARVDVLTTHALFAPGAMDRLREVGVGDIWSTDSIPHETNAIPLAGLLAGAVRETEHKLIA